MMDSIKNLLETLKEKIKSSWAEQQESAFFIEIKERYEQLPLIAQKGINWGGAVLAVVFILWIPVSYMMDSNDFNTLFDERRQILKDLLRLERDISNQPMIPTSLPPSAFKSGMDQKLVAAGVKPEQIKIGGVELQVQNVSGAEERGVQYRLDHITVRQAIDIAYELEHADPSLRLGSIEFLANPTDPHFYEVAFKIVNFAPKLAEMNFPSSGGKGIADAIKEKNGGSKTPPPPPPPGEGGI